MRWKDYHGNWAKDTSGKEQGTSGGQRKVRSNRVMYDTTCLNYGAPTTVR